MMIEITKTVQEIGLVKKIVRLPLERIMDCLKEVSKRVPKTKARTMGAAG